MLSQKDVINKEERGDNDKHSSKQQQQQCRTDWKLTAPYWVTATVSLCASWEKAAKSWSWMCQ